MIHSAGDLTDRQKLITLRVESMRYVWVLEGYLSLIKQIIDNGELTGRSDDVKAYLDVALKQISQLHQTIDNAD